VGRCISKRKYLIGTTIKSTDFDNMYDIFCKSGVWSQYHRDRLSKQTGKIYKSSVISFFGKHTYNFLLNNDYSIKSHTEPTKILNIIPKKYHSDFYRGYIDGDGSFSCYVGTNGTTMSCKFNITSTYEQNWDFIEIIFKEINIESYNINRYDRIKNKSSIIGISNKWDIIKIGDYLYDSPIKLERKYLKFLEIFSFF